MNIHGTNLVLHAQRVGYEMSEICCIEISPFQVEFVAIHCKEKLVTSFY